MTFWLTMRNVGYSRAYDVVVEDQLPPGLAFIEDTSLVVWPGGKSEVYPGGAPGPLLSWFTGASLDVGEALVVTFNALVTGDGLRGEDVRNAMWAGAVDDFNVPIRADSSMSVPPRTTPTTSLRSPSSCGLRPRGQSRHGTEAGSPGPERPVGGPLWGAGLVEGLAFRFRWPRGKASRVLGIGLFPTLALTGLAFVATRAGHAIIARSEPPKGGILFGAGTYKAGEMVQLKTLPNQGFEFAGWFEDGAEISTSPLVEFVGD